MWHIDSHIHLISPQQAFAALSNGVATFFGGGVGPTDGSNGTTVTAGPWNIRAMLRAFEGIPVNIGLLGKGNSFSRAPLEEQIIAGVSGLKVHEDWGATPNALRHSLRIADEMYVQVSVHTDSLNEAGYVENTIEAFEGRTIHTFHTEGAGVLIGVIFTVFVQGAMNTLMSPLGIPTLTMPFVLASWLFLVPNQDVMPPHRQA